MRKGGSDVEVKCRVSSRFYCICTMPAATTPNVRTLEMTPWEIPVPFIFIADYRTALTPSLLPYTGKLFLLAQQSALLPLRFYCITSWLGVAAQCLALMSTFQPIRRRGKGAQTSPLSQPTRNLPPLCTSHWLQLGTWLHLAVGEAGK